MLSMSAQDQVAALDWLQNRACRRWFVLTRLRSCPAVVRQTLAHLGTVASRLKRGQHLLARAGSWHTGDVRTAKSGEDWLLWVPRATDKAQILLLARRIQSMPLTASGKVPLSRSCLAMREAAHGQAGPYYGLAGTVMATDGSLRADGMMRCAVVSLDGSPPIRRAVPGEPSSTRAIRPPSCRRNCSSRETPDGANGQPHLLAEPSGHAPG